MIKVAVVILNWNGKDFLERFLPSVLDSCLTFNKQKRYQASVVVVDNGSTDDSRNSFKKVKEQFVSSVDSNLLKESSHKEIASHIRWMQLSENYGFALGYNKAFEVIGAAENFDYYVLLNSDVYTPKNWLAPLVNFMEYRQNAGVCSPKILAWSRREEILKRLDNTEQFEYAGAAGGYIDKWGFPFCRGRILSTIEDDLKQYDMPLRTFWASGACMIVRSKVWHELGGFDADFFAHMEEIDFCWRTALKSYEVWCNPQSYIYHVGGGTLPNNSPRKLFLNYRNNLIMLRKNLPAKGLSKKIFIRKIIDGLSAIAYLCTGRLSFANSVLKAHIEYNKKKKTIGPSPRNCSEIYGIYNKSIILSYFTGKKRFNDLRFY